MCQAWDFAGEGGVRLGACRDDPTRWQLPLAARNSNGGFQSGRVVPLGAKRTAVPPQTRNTQAFYYYCPERNTQGSNMGGGGGEGMCNYPVYNKIQITLPETKPKAVRTKTDDTGIAGELEPREGGARGDSGKTDTGTSPYILRKPSQYDTLDDALDARVF